MKRKIGFDVNGQKVVGVLHHPETDKPPAIIMVHGFKGDKNEHGRFNKAADEFIKNGFCVLRFDCRGTNESDGEFKNMTIDTEVEDLLSAIEFVKEQDVDENRIGILGLSLGGEISILNAVKTNPKALVLWAPVTKSKHWKTKFTPEHIHDFNTKGTIIIHSRTTGKPYVIGRGFFDSAINTKVENELKNLKCPVLIIHGDKDDSVPLEHSKQAIEKITSEKELRIIKGEDHGFYGQIDEIIELSLRWFRKYL